MRIARIIPAIVFIYAFLKYQAAVKQIRSPPAQHFLVKEQKQKSEQAHEAVAKIASCRLEDVEIGCEYQDQYRNRP